MLVIISYIPCWTSVVTFHVGHHKLPSMLVLMQYIIVCNAGTSSQVTSVGSLLPAGNINFSEESFSETNIPKDIFTFNIDLCPSSAHLLLHTNFGIFFRHQTL
ncbi:hypothetical protein OTU49_005355 [Cherax quadricarinatus]|uniref:Uncharacterized protein n=1 Tax=Cherax quadricarinatus TaxID=27406 RepID=A0AAW0XCS3_CHEQU